MLEKYGFYILAVGLAIGVVGYVWLIVRAFKERFLWGVATLLPPFALLFLFLRRKKVRGPAFVLALAAVTIAAPYCVSYYERHFIPLEPYEQIVDGEHRITLTGLKDFDYSTLQSKRDIVVLQMANADVNDQTLELLHDMPKLRKLDVNGSQVTDDGLARIAELPALQELYLARTRITDEGFRKHLADKETLVHLDLTGTAVKSKTKRAWKNQRPDVREYVD